MGVDFHYVCIFLDICLALLLTTSVYHVSKIAYRLVDGICLFLGDYKHKGEQLETMLKDDKFP